MNRGFSGDFSRESAGKFAKIVHIMECLRRCAREKMRPGTEEAPPGQGHWRAKKIGPGTEEATPGQQRNYARAGPLEGKEDTPGHRRSYARAAKKIRPGLTGGSGDILGYSVPFISGNGPVMAVPGKVPRDAPAPAIFPAPPPRRGPGR